MNPHELVQLLDGRDLRPRPAGPGKWESRCPSHDDSKASLSIGTGHDERVLVHCHAGCELGDILGVLGLTNADLFATSNGNSRKITETYDYTDEHGELLYQAVRFDPKDFRQRRPDGKGDWVWKLDDVQRVLFQLPRVLEAVTAGETIYVAEGERDVLALERAGVAATCNPMGAGKWEQSYSKALAGAIVVVIADRDPAGRRHAQEVAQSLAKQKCKVTIVEAAEGKDAHDHITRGGTVEDFVAMVEDADAKPSAAADAFTTASAIRPRRIRWAWQGRLALGYLSLWSGESSLGKSTHACSLIAQLTHGSLEGHLAGKPANVLVVASEDAREDMWVPRLIAAEDDLARVQFQNQTREWNLRDGMKLTADALDQGDAKFVLIDSVLEHMPDPKSGESINQPTFIRRSLGNFADLCKARHIAGLVSTHPPKSKGSTFADSVISSAAFVHMTRVGLLFAWHPQDLELPDQERRRVLMRPPGGSNIGRDPGTFEFSIGIKELLIEGELEEVPYTTPLVPSDVTYRDLTRTAVGEGPARPKIADAKLIIDKHLGDGEWHPSMIDELIGQGFTKTTAYEAAAGVVKHKADFSGDWFWARPGTSKSSFVEVARNPGPSRARAGGTSRIPDLRGKDLKTPTNTPSSEGPGELDENRDGESVADEGPKPEVLRARTRGGQDADDQALVADCEALAATFEAEAAEREAQS